MTPPPIDLRPLFAPRSIAVVGATPRSTIARTVRDNLVRMDSPTRCYFVNPRYDEVDGTPCHPSLEALPERPDVVLLAVNPLRAAPFAQQAADAGVPALVIPGGGVVEGGEAAAQMQRDVARIARTHGIALLGPNCMGVVDRTTNSAVYIGDINPWQPRGGVAGIAQSGSVTDAFIHAGDRVGFSRIIGCGAEAVLDLCDHLAYCLDDPETHSIILFVEGFKRPERFLALADRALALGKPIAAVKVGRSPQAQEAAVAHTGSLAGEARVTDAALDAVGIIRCADLDELLETAELLEGCRRTRRRVGRGRAGVVTVSTGEASLIADLAPRTGIDLPAVPPATLARLLAALPTLGYVGNPLDPWGATDAPEAYSAAFDAFAASGAYDVLVAVHDFPYRSLPSEVEVAEDVTRPLLAATANRPDLLPVFVSLTSGEPTPEVKALLDAAGGVPLLRGAVEAFAAIASVARWEAKQARRATDGPIRPAWPDLASDRTPYAHDGDRTTDTDRSTDTGAGPSPAPTVLSERDSLALLASLGTSVTPWRVAPDPSAAAAAASALGFPVALKLDADGLAHKTETGAVVLGLTDDAAVAAAADRLIADGRRNGLAVRGVLVEPMAGPGVELIVGARRDPLFGPVVLVGLGGTLAEILDDVAIGLAPLSADRAAALVASLRGARLLDGVRGGQPVDRAAVANLLVGLGRALVARPDVREVDLNPVVASAAGAVAVDALVVIEGVADD